MTGHTRVLLTRRARSVRSVKESGKWHHSAPRGEFERSFLNGLQLSVNRRFAAKSAVANCSTGIITVTWTLARSGLAELNGQAIVDGSWRGLIVSNRVQITRRY